MSKITRKSYKRKKILMGAVLFGGVGLVSTGFAAWVLSSSVSTDQPASLSVGLVDDKNMTFEGVEVVTTGTSTVNNIYHFEPAADDSTGRVRWDGVNAELLSLTVKGEIYHTQNLGTITAKVSVLPTGQSGDEGYVSETDAKAHLDEAVTKGYIVAPEFYALTETTIFDGTDVATGLDAEVTVGQNTVINASNETDVKRAFTVEVKFGWGTAFGGVNPSEYYDSDAGKDVPQGSYGDTYETLIGGQHTVAGILTDMHDLLDNIQIQITLTANPS